MLSQFCVRSENEKQQTAKTERAMLSQFCVRSENEKQKNCKERAAVAVFVSVQKMRSNKETEKPCCRSLCSF